MGTLTVNKRAAFDYEILEKFKAGVELTGHEVKSAKMGRINVSGAHAIIRGNEVFLVGAEVSSFQPKNAPAGYEAGRTKRLLLRKREIKYLFGKTQSGLTLIPLGVFTERGLIKIELGLARGKKKHDKREAIKKREVKKEIRRFVK